MKFIGFFLFLISLCTNEASADEQHKIKENRGCQQQYIQEQLYYVAEAPQSLQELWENTPKHFEMKEYVKQHDARPFAKWRQLKKLWSKDKNEAGHYERKESIVITSENTDLNLLKKCRQDMQQFCIEHLKKVEEKYNLSPASLTMERATNPTHTLRLLHYFSNATATAHCDTSRDIVKSCVSATERIPMIFPKLPVL